MDLEVCWCGDIHSPHCPTCDKCGAPVTTGFMVFICPHGEDCHFMPDDEESRAFVREQRPYWKDGVAVVPVTVKADDNGT